ncbi:MAG: ribonuclease P protein subunit [Candidatus Woesearchaeota archaeon]|jgi:RNase P/RNase MRP subunit p29|nr:ribonuclease P protein subunit [Candidatus Woesearchaeota archaeon]
MVEIKGSVKIPEKKQVEFDVLCLSLVGKEIEIVDSKNKLQIGFKGVLVLESANLFYIEVDKDTRNQEIHENSKFSDAFNQSISGQSERSSDSIKKFLKNGLVIKFDYNGKNLIVDCSILSGSLVSRIKKIK